MIITAKNFTNLYVFPPFHRRCQFHNAYEHVTWRELSTGLPQPGEPPDHVTARSVFATPIPLQLPTLISVGGTTCLDSRTPSANQRHRTSDAITVRCLVDTRDREEWQRCIVSAEVLRWCILFSRPHYLRRPVFYVIDYDAHP